MILQGDATAMPFDDESIDAIVTDPPYGLGFMGKEWDREPPGELFVKEALRVLKPGGHIIAFGGTRTIYILGYRLLTLGFHIRDTIGWLQWQGFPKSLDVSKAIDAALAGLNQKQLPSTREVIGFKNSTSDNYREGEGWEHSGGKRNRFNPATTNLITAPATPEAKYWHGWGTALKPAIEPAVLARKPLIGTVAANILAHGTGGLNIDGCRYAYGDDAWPGPAEEFKPCKQGTMPQPMDWGNSRGDVLTLAHALGRWPANIYACPKPSRAEREAGCEHLQPRAGHEAVDRTEGSVGAAHPRAGAGGTADEVRNFHPTVKPIRLMRWLVRLVTPPGGIVLDPFAGSGTTICAAHCEGIRAVGLELNPEYIPIAQARSAHWEKYREAAVAESKAIREDAAEGQMRLFT